MDHNNKRTFIKKIFFAFAFSLFLITGFSKPVYSQCDTSLCPYYQISYCSDAKCRGCAWCNQVVPLPTSIPGSKQLGRLEGLGPLGDTLNYLTKGIDSPLILLNKVISIGIGLITLFAFLYFILQFFTAALKWITAGGDQKSVEAAGKQITNALIGLVIVVSATFIIELVGMVLGIELLNPFDFLKNIWKPII